MDDQGTDNIITYELYLSKPPDQQLVERYKTFLDTLAEGEFSLDLQIQQDLVIKVQDNDGDILLIEAAEHLPHWLESKESENRVFIHNGQIHIIPRNINLNDLQATTNPPISVVHSAAKFIRENTSVDTLAGPSVQNAIKKQLSGLPDKKAWLTKKFQQLDEIISVNDFNESLTLASVMNMLEEDLQISPISSLSSTTMSSSITSVSSASSSTSSAQSIEQPLELQND